MALGNRANNPGNVSLPIKGWTGGGAIIGAPGQPGYAQFPDFATGVSAWSVRLDTYAQRPGGDTIRGLNDTIGYATDPNWKNNVSAGSGLGLDTPLDTSNRGALMIGIAKAEGNYGGLTLEERSILANSGQSSYYPEYNNFSPSGYDYSGDQAPGSFSDTMPTNVPYENFSRQDNSLTQQEGSFTTFGGVNGHFQPGSDLMTGNPWSTDKNQTDAAPTDATDKPSSTIEDASYIKGDSVTDPKAASQGQGTDVPTAIVTAANQEAKTTAAAAKTTAEATLNATKTQTASDAKLQGEQQGWAANWAVRIFLFIVGAIFLGGALFLFGGQAMFSKSTA